MPIIRKLQIMAAKLPSLEEFLLSPDKQSYIQHKGLKSYTRKGPRMIDGEKKLVIERANTYNPKRLRNITNKAKKKSTGLYRQLDEHTHEMARKHGYDGVYIENVLNDFLPDKLREYGYHQVNDDPRYPNPPCFYKASK